jgi:hypothetical protein
VFTPVLGQLTKDSKKQMDVSRAAFLAFLLSVDSSQTIHLQSL